MVLPMARLVSRSSRSLAAAVTLWAGTGGFVPRCAAAVATRGGGCGGVPSTRTARASATVSRQRIAAATVNVTAGTSRCMGQDYKDMAGWQDFTGLNRGYVLELYEKYRHDPSSVDPGTRALFETWTPPAEADRTVADGLSLEKIVGAVNLAESIRRYGHLAA